jgi:WD40 repeat protein
VIQSIQDEDSRLTYIAVHPDGKRIAIGTTQGKTLFWNLDTGEVQSLFAGDPDIWHFGHVFSHDGTRLVAADDTGTLFVWEVETLGTTAHLQGA